MFAHTLVHKDTQTLLDAVKAQHPEAKIVRQSRHIVVSTKNGGRPVTFPAMPGDSRWRDPAVANLIRHGFLERDPWAPPKPNTKSRPAESATEPTEPEKSMDEVLQEQIVLHVLHLTTAYSAPDFAVALGRVIAAGKALYSHRS